MNEVKIFNNEEFGQIRSIMIDGEPWFVGKDVARALGYENTKDAIAKHVDEEDKQILQRSQNTTLENYIPKSALPVNFVLADIPNRGLTIINESGLYALVFGSKLESARKFKHWVTSEILPSIRKTGTYSNKGTQTERIPVGEVARLSAVMDRVMVRQNSKPHDIARAFEILCEQFGIMLPDNFVNTPEYEQMTLANVIGRH